MSFKFKHLRLLHDMLESQKYIGICDITMKTLPKIGYITMLNEQPVAAGFLRRVEPCFAQIDTLVSSAYFGSKIRHEGITLVVNNLLLDGRSLKLKGVLAFTSDNGILNRAKELGFHEVNQTIIAKELK